MSLRHRLFQFFLSDAIWVVGGQLAALCIGLASLKIYTQLFDAEHYAYLALFTAISGWTWLGLYQPLNQAVFRFFPVAQQRGNTQPFFDVWRRNRQRLFTLCLLLGAAICALTAAMSQWRYMLLVMAAIALGVVSGQLHGYVSYYLSQRLRRPVALIQSLDGICRLAGGLAGFALLRGSELATLAGIVIGASLLLLGVQKASPLQGTSKGQAADAIADPLPADFQQYMGKMFVLMLLNASVMNLDKWLMLPLLGAHSLGIYAIVQTLAMTASTVMYGVFEMLFFPLIFNQPSASRRQRYTRLMSASFALALTLAVSASWLGGSQILQLLTNEQAAEEGSLLAMLVAGCGLFQLARLTMVEALYRNAPQRYWPAYTAFILTFALWSLLFLQEGAVIQAGQGFLVSSCVFLICSFAIGRTLPLSTPQNDTP